MTATMRKLEYFEEELGASAMGRQILSVVRAHMEEVTALINGNRIVMVAWQRNKGPRFLLSAMDSGFDEHTSVVKEIEGVTLERLLLRMADALQQAGGPALKAAVARYTMPALELARRCDSLAELFAALRTEPSAGATP